MKTGFLFTAAIALTLFGMVWGWRNYSKEAGPGVQVPPALAFLTSGGDPKPSTLPDEIKPSAVITEKDRTQLNTLNSILASHNDNDMRLDTELKDLAEGAKELLRQKYLQIANEARNQRGTVLFLLGRNLSTEKDLQFFRDVLQEQPCRSLSDCNKDPPTGEAAHMHEESGMDVTLNYPQIMVLKGVERVLKAGQNHLLYRQSIELVHQAAHSSTEKISAIARDIEARFSP